jgi:hypothetical protein
VGECALLAQQVEPRREPNVARDDGRVHGEVLRSMFNEPILNKPILNKPILNKPILNKPILNKPILNKVV